MLMLKSNIILKKKNVNVTLNSFSTLNLTININSKSLLENDIIKKELGTDLDFQILKIDDYTGLKYYTELSESLESNLLKFSNVLPGDTLYSKMKLYRKVLGYYIIQENIKYNKINDAVTKALEISNLKKIDETFLGIHYNGYVLCNYCYKDPSLSIDVLKQHLSIIPFFRSNCSLKSILNGTRDVLFLPKESEESLVTGIDLVHQFPNDERRNQEFVIDKLLQYTDSCRDKIYDDLKKTILNDNDVHFDMCFLLFNQFLSPRVRKGTYENSYVDARSNFICNIDLSLFLRYKEDFLIFVDNLNYFIDILSICNSTDNTAKNFFWNKIVQSPSYVKKNNISDFKMFYDFLFSVESLQCKIDPLFLTMLSNLAKNLNILKSEILFFLPNKYNLRQRLFLNIKNKLNFWLYNSKFAYYKFTYSMIPFFGITPGASLLSDPVRRILCLAYYKYISRKNNTIDTAAFAQGIASTPGSEINHNDYLLWDNLKNQQKSKIQITSDLKKPADSLLRLPEVTDVFNPANFFESWYSSHKRLFLSQIHESAAIVHMNKQLSTREIKFALSRLKQNQSSTDTEKTPDGVILGGDDNSVIRPFDIKYNYTHKGVLYNGEMPFLWKNCINDNNLLIVVTNPENIKTVAKSSIKFLLSEEQKRELGVFPSISDRRRIEDLRKFGNDINGLQNSDEVTDFLMDYVFLHNNVETSSLLPIIPIAFSRVKPLQSLSSIANDYYEKNNCNYALHNLLREQNCITVAEFQSHNPKLSAAQVSDYFSQTDILEKLL